MIPAPYPPPPPPADDTRDGLAMLLVFIVAVLTVTGAVAVLAVIGTWWTLGGVVVGVHAIATVVVGLTIMWVMTGRPEAMRSGASSPPEDQARAVARRSRGVSRPRRGEPHMRPQPDRSDVQAGGDGASTTGGHVPRPDIGRTHQSTPSVEPPPPSSSIREPNPGIKT